MLNCTNPAFDEQELLDLAADALPHLDVDDLQADYEHGQWWITHVPSGAQWSVHDCSGPAVFDFERVSDGDGSE